MQITINQKTIDVKSELSLLEALSIAAIPTQNIAVAINNKIIYRSEWEGYALKEGDNLLVIKAAKGG